MAPHPSKDHSVPLGTAVRYAAHAQSCVSQLMSWQTQLPMVKFNAGIYHTAMLPRSLGLTTDQSCMTNCSKFNSLPYCCCSTPVKQKSYAYAAVKPNRRNACSPCFCFVVNSTPELWQSGEMAFNVVGTYTAAWLHQFMSNTNQLLYLCLKTVNLLTSSLQINSHATLLAFV